MEFNVRARRSLRATRYMRRATSVSGLYSAKSAGRFSRHSHIVSRTNSFSANKLDEYRIRKSLADYVKEELDQQGRALFHQRITIVGKNPAGALTSTAAARLTPISLTPKKHKPQQSTLQQAQAQLQQSIHSLASKRSIFSTHSIHSVLSSSKKLEEESDSESATEPEESEEKLAESSSELDFKANLRERLIAIQQQCYKETFTTDQLNGLCLNMGEYTLLVLEGADDLVGEFCTELAKIADQLWTINRVLQVEDRIGDMYFNSLFHRFCAPININEKFPTATPNDNYLMGQQHWQLIQKTKAVCTTLATELRERKDPMLAICNKLRQLNVEHFNKLLPEVQRLELVLNSTRFYRNVQDFSTIYWHIPMEQDDDALIWPVPFEFTPLGVFVRSPFDVNLTFADYGNVEENQPDSEHFEGEEDSEPH